MRARAAAPGPPLALGPSALSGPSALGPSVLSGRTGGVSRWLEAAEELEAVGLAPLERLARLARRPAARLRACAEAPRSAPSARRRASPWPPAWASWGSEPLGESSGAVGAWARHAEARVRCAWVAVAAATAVAVAVVVPYAAWAAVRHGLRRVAWPCASAEAGAHRPPPRLLPPGGGGPVATTASARPSGHGSWGLGSPSSRPATPTTRRQLKRARLSRRSQSRSREASRSVALHVARDGHGHRG